jgi:hypothetical protein
VRCSWKGQGDEPSFVVVGISGVYPKDAAADKSCKFGYAFGELFTGSIAPDFFSIFLTSATARLGSSCMPRYKCGLNECCPFSRSRAGFTGYVGFRLVRRVGSHYLFRESIALELHYVGAEAPVVCEGVLQATSL